LVSHQSFAPAPGGYEFDAIESNTIEKIGRRTRMWGIISLVLGIALVVGLVVFVALADELKSTAIGPYVYVGVASMVPLVIVHVAIAALYIGSGGALLRCVSTQGNDIEHLLAGLAKMGTAFKVEFIVTLVGIVAGFSVGVALVGNL
jgi:hypothetical protein